MLVTDETPEWNDTDVTTLHISQVVKHYSALLTVLQILHSHKHNVTSCMIMKWPHFLRATKDRKFNPIFRWIWQLHTSLIHSCYGICQHLFHLLYIFHIKKVLQPHRCVCVYICKCLPLSWGKYATEIIYMISIFIFSCYLPFKFCSFLFFQQSAFPTQIIIKTHSSNMYSIMIHNSCSISVVSYTFLLQ